MGPLILLRESILVVTCDSGLSPLGGSFPDAQLAIIILVHVVMLHCKKRGVLEHPMGAIFYCFHGNLCCYHGNSKILLPWGVQLHRVFYSVARLVCLANNNNMEG